MTADDGATTDSEGGRGASDGRAGGQRADGEGANSQRTDDEGANSQRTDDEGSGDFPADERRRELLRTVAEEVRDDSSESRQLAAILYRVSDLYDPEEETSPEEIYRNVRTIAQIKARGGLERNGTDQ